MRSQTDVDLPIFSTFPGLLDSPPRVRQLEGKWVIEWRWTSKDKSVTLVLHAFVTSAPLWSYAIWDAATNTVSHYIGRDADIEKDRLVKIEQGEPPS